MRFLLGLLLTSIAWAQTLTPSTVSFIGRGNWAPPDQFTTVAASCGSVSVGAWGGDVNLAPGVATTVTGAAGSQVINVFLSGASTYGLTFSVAGILHTATATVTFSGACSGTQTLTVNYTAFSRAIASFWYPGGSCIGCTVPTGGAASLTPWQDPAATALPSPMNPGNATVVPQISCPGGTWTDPVLGSTMTCVSPNGLNQAVASDSTNSGINADHTIVNLIQLGGVNSGSIYLTKTDGSGTQCKTPSPSNLNPMWDPKSLSSPYKFYIFNGLSLQSYTFAFAGCTFTGPTTIYTYGGSGTGLANSGDGMVPLNGKLSFVVSGGDTVMGVVDVNTGVAITHDWSSDPAFATPRGAIYSSVNASEATGKQYVHFDAQFNTNSNEVLSFPANFSALTVEGPEARIPETIYANGGTPFLAYQPATSSDCTTFGACQSTVHACPFETRINGKMHEFYMSTLGDLDISQNVQSMMDFDGGVKNWQRIVEDSGAGASGNAGPGALYGNFPLDNATSATHMSCAQYAAVSAVSVEPAAVTAYQITGLATGNPPTITTGSTTGLANGNSVMCGGIGGIAAMPPTGVIGIVANLTGTTFQLSGINATGTYTANTGTCMKNNGPPADPHAMEVIVMDLTNITAPRVIRLIHHNSIVADDRFAGGAYWPQAHVGLSPDAKLACFTTNFGVLENYHAVCLPTGYPWPVSMAAVGASAVAAGR